MERVRNSTVVYLHRRKDNDRIFYVGIGKGNRPYTKRKNSMWNSVVGKYGYYVEIIYRDLSWEEACLIEKYIIKLLGRRDLGKGYLVNMTDGGEGNQNMIYTPEWREKQRIASTGRKLSPESLQKKSNSLIGKKFSEERKENIRKTKIGLHRGSNNPSAKLTEEIVLKIREEHYQGASILSLSKKYGCGWTTAKRIIDRETWKHI